MHGSDFTFMGLWHALPWIRVFRMNVDTKIPCVFSQWSPYNQSGRWYRMCKTNRDHKNTYLSKLVLQAVVVSQINFACFWNWNSNKQRSGKDVSNYFLIWSPLKSPRSFSCKLQYALINSLGFFYLSIWCFKKCSQKWGLAETTCGDGWTLQLTEWGEMGACARASEGETVTHPTVRWGISCNYKSHCFGLVSAATCTLAFSLSELLWRFVLYVITIQRGSAR